MTPEWSKGVNLPVKNSKTGNHSPNSSWFLCFPVLGSQSMYVNTLTWTTTTTTTVLSQFLSGFSLGVRMSGKKKRKDRNPESRTLDFLDPFQAPKFFKMNTFTFKMNTVTFTVVHWIKLRKSGVIPNNFQTVNVLNVLNVQTHEWWIFLPMVFSILNFLHQKSLAFPSFFGGGSFPRRWTHVVGGVFLGLFVSLSFLEIVFFGNRFFFTDDWWCVFFLFSGE